VPAGTGTNLFGIGKGFDEFHRLGFTTRVPSIVAVQPVGSDPLVRAHDRGDAIILPLDEARSNVALPITHRVTGHHTYEAVRQSHGTAVAVTDGEIRQALLDLAGRPQDHFIPFTAVITGAGGQENQESRARDPPGRGDREEARRNGISRRMEQGAGPACRDGDRYVAVTIRFQPTAHKERSADWGFAPLPLIRLAAKTLVAPAGFEPAFWP
jgi:hypothetical protein